MITCCEDSSVATVLDQLIQRRAFFEEDRFVDISSVDGLARAARALGGPRRLVGRGI